MSLKIRQSRLLSSAALTCLIIGILFFYITTKAKAKDVLLSSRAPRVLETTDSKSKSILMALCYRYLHFIRQRIGASKMLTFFAFIAITKRSTGKSPTQQNPLIAPPVPIVSLSSQYIQSALEASKTTPKRALNSNGAEVCGLGNPCADNR